jgi:hypothetical protein
MLKPSLLSQGCVFVTTLMACFKFYSSGPAGLPDFSSHRVPKRGEIYQIATNVPNGHKLYQMAVIYSKWPNNEPTFSIARPSIIYPNYDFWFGLATPDPGFRSLLASFRVLSDFFAVVAAVHFTMSPCFSVKGQAEVFLHTRSALDVATNFALDKLFEA